jgi:hypothetical protein
MTHSQAQEILLAWEDGAAASPGECGLILLRLAEPQLSEAACRALSVGRRDAALLRLHERLFGPVAHALADCPSCNEPLELDVPLAAIRVEAADEPPERFELTHAGQALTFRLPTAGDLAQFGARRDEPSSADGVARLCLVSPADAGPADPATAAALEAAIGEAVSRHDPQAVVSLAFDCPACAAHWTSPFDIVGFLWPWLGAFAQGLLAEVHLIASAYGWSEDQILALSPGRRRRYIGLISA